MPLRSCPTIVGEGAFRTAAEESPLSQHLPAVGLEEWLGALEKVLPPLLPPITHPWAELALHVAASLTPAFSSSSLPLQSPTSALLLLTSPGFLALFPSPRLSHLPAGGDLQKHLQPPLPFLSLAPKALQSPVPSWPATAHPLVLGAGLPQDSLSQRPQGASCAPPAQGSTHNMHTPWKDLELVLLPQPPLASPKALVTPGQELTKRAAPPWETPQGQGLIPSTSG